MEDDISYILENKLISSVRRHERFDVNKPAILKVWIVINTKKIKRFLQCIVKNISQSGLLLELNVDTPFDFKSSNARYFIKFGSLDKEIFLVRIINSYKAAFTFIKQ